MGLLDGLMGNASEIDATKVNEEFARLLAPGEQVERAYQLIRDSFFFTNRRLILVDRQGLTGKKTSHDSIPYRSITRFSRKLSIYEVQAVLASYVFGKP